MSSYESAKVHYEVVTFRIKYRPFLLITIHQCKCGKICDKQQCLFMYLRGVLSKLAV